MQGVYLCKTELALNSPNFKGMMYAKAGEHLTKGVFSCRLGDRKLIKFFNTLAESSPEKLSVSIDNNKLIIESSELPEITRAEKCFNIVKPIQNKLFNKIKQDIFNKIVYKLNEEEYSYWKNNNIFNIFFKDREFKTFEDNIRMLIDKKDLEKVKSFFNN